MNEGRILLHSDKTKMTTPFVEARQNTDTAYRGLFGERESKLTSIPVGGKIFKIESDVVR